MISQQILSRSLGQIGPYAFQLSESNRLLQSIQAAPYVRFDSKSTGTSTAENTTQVWAHRAGVNTLALETLESRFLLTGGADASIALWDLTATPTPSFPTNESPIIHRPITSLPKTSHGHQYGLTHVSWWPFDNQAFLSSSYDHKLHLYATPELSSTSKPSAIFELQSAIHHHAISPIASHLLVACATQHPSIRLVDLKSNASTHTLPGHSGAVLSVAWSPRDENILASAGSDGTVRLWDIRRSASSLGLLDIDDSEGILRGVASNPSAPVTSQVNDHHRKAHVGAANGVAWTQSGDFLVTSGHDARIRIWDMATGANTLAHFGPRVRNSALNAVLPVIVPENITGLGNEVLLFPSGEEILVAELREGTTIKRLKIPKSSKVQGGGGGGKGGRRSVKAIVWREGYCEAYSAHADGLVRAWWPKTEEDQDADQEEKEEEQDILNQGEEGERKRKREALDQVFRDLTRQKMTFT